MLLKSIELTGFKSFAKKSLFSFGSAITGIVGPNGSGKSNVAESFRFVLGEQSIKSLRGKRGEDMIWNGNADVPRGNRAGVKVVFNNADRFFAIDFSEVVLERIVHRDGTNEYLINGSQVRLKDVVELLAQANIGSTGHHIISQGEADRILSASAKERKNMIEDALGLKAYQYKKEESIKKLEKTKENIERVGSLRREIAPHIKFLKKQVEKIEKAEEMRVDLRTKYHEYLAREYAYLEAEKQDIIQKQGPQEEKQRRLSETITRLSEVIEESKEDNARGVLLIKAEEALSEARKGRERLVMERGVIMGEKGSLERLIREEERRQEVDVHKSVPLSEIEQVFVQVETAGENTTLSLQDFVTTVKNLLQKLIHTYKEVVDDMRLTTYKTEYAEIQAKALDIEAQLNDATEKERQARDAYEHTRREIESAKDTSRDAETEVFKLLAERQEVESLLHDLRMRQEIEKRARAEFEREVSEGHVLIGSDILSYKSAVAQYSDAPLDNDRSEQEERRRHIEKIKIRLEDMGAGGGSEVLKEYTQASERDEFLARELIDLEQSVKSLEQLITDLEQELREKFASGMDRINQQFNEFFNLMFGGGHATIKIIKEVKRKRTILLEEGDVDTEEGEEHESGEYEEGVEVDISLPRKRIKGLMMLSGGERALTSIALLFAISQVNPPPFIILDETDAALDEANSKKYGDMIEALAKSSQLILITHNRETMSRAGAIYGVTMGKDGVSKLLSISFDEAETVAK